MAATGPGALLLAVGSMCLSLLGAPAAHAAAAPADGDDAAPAKAAAPADDAPSGGEAAEAPPAAKLKSFPKLKQPPLNHDMQFGIAVFSGSGYRGIFPYQENIYCGQLGKRVCATRVPVYLDVQPSFGFAQHWDVLVDLRFGLEQDVVSETHDLSVAAGFRYWVDPDLPAKFYATLQGSLDATAEHVDALKKTDVAFRNANGFMFEVMRNLGFFAQFGETIGFVRWLELEIDLSLGVQARLP
jgi:hypothetical protein